ncbi:MAG: class II aldolase/adducin family protein [Burkholderiaceae bacterium]
MSDKTDNNQMKQASGIAPNSENSFRQAIIDCCRQLNTANLNTGRAGNLSTLWHRGGEAGMLITPSAMHYDQMTIDDIVWMPLKQPAGKNDAMVTDGHNKPSSEWRMHQTLYLSSDGSGNPGNSGTRAVLHVHSPFATTLACLPRVQAEGLPAFHYMIAVAGGNNLRCAPYALFGSEELSAAMQQAIAGRRACLLANHGQIAVGADIRAAFDLAAEVEDLCRLYWQALQIGEPVILTDKQMVAVHESFASYSYRK